MLKRLRQGGQLTWIKWYMTHLKKEFDILRNKPLLFSCWELDKEIDTTPKFVRLNMKLPQAAG